MTNETRDDRGPSDPDSGATDDEIIRADARVGRALVASVVVLLVVAIVGAAVWWMTRERPVETPPAPPPPAPSSAREAPAGAVIRLPFRNVLGSSGILFERENGATGEKMLPETMGGGVAIADFDGDGRQDLLFVNGADWPWTGTNRLLPPTAKLFLNLGQGTFLDVTNRSGIDVPVQGMGVAVGDYDGDGRPDVLITAVGQDRLFRNETESAPALRFRDVTQEVGLPIEDAWGTSAGFLDHDRDGDLDLFVCRYVAWSPEIDRQVGYQLTGIGRAYGPPTGFAGVDCRLYRNDGGRFVDVTEEAGIAVRHEATGKPVGKALGVVFVDVDRDGWIDILVANDTVRNFHFRNLGGEGSAGRFREIGASSGFAYDRNGNATGAMGIDAAWFREDGRLGVAIGNFANEMSSLFVAEPRRDGSAGSDRFADDAIPEGFGPPTRRVLTFGTLFFDADLDGWPDLLQVNGHLEEEINRVYRSQEYRQSAQLFRNVVGIAPEGPAFVELPNSALDDLAVPFVGRGAAFGDLDGDGDIDLVLVQPKGEPLVLINEQATRHRLVRLRLVGRGMNRDAIGAEIELVADGRLRRATVMPTRSYLSQVELPVTFGLGATGRIDAIRIRWPDGSEQIVDPATVPIGRTTTIEQPER